MPSRTHRADPPGAVSRRSHGGYAGSYAEAWPEQQNQPRRRTARGKRMGVLACVALVASAALIACSSDSPAPRTPVVRAPTATPRPSPTPLPPNEVLFRAGGVGIIEVAFNRIVDEHVEAVDPAALLAAAWDGVRRAADARGFAPPAAPSFIGARAADFAAFEAAYASLPGDLGEDRLTRFTAISAMARSLDDCHTFFIGPSADDARDVFKDKALSDFGMTLAGHPPVITDTESFSPASLAGLRPGDTIVGINDEATADAGPVDVLLLLYEYEEGSSVDVRLRRPGYSDELTLPLELTSYTPPNIQSQVINHDVGYVRIRSWTGEGLARRLRTILERFSHDKIAKWIIDLRGDPGGVVDDAAISLFVPDGVIVRTLERGGRIRETRASGDALEHVPPLAILIDDGSASMSESFALTLQEYGIARLVGTKSAGCIGETYVAGLGAGSGLAVTFALIQGPKSGDDAYRSGLTPDEIVERTTDDIIANRDPPLDAAIAYLAMPTATATPGS